MAVVTTDSRNYRDIADAIRKKTGIDAAYRPNQMAAAITAISGEGGAPVYDGSYTVRPEVDAQTLETKSKIMQDNLTIMAIPYHAVDNPQSGQTVIIGGIDYYGN